MEVWLTVINLKYVKVTLTECFITFLFGINVVKYDKEKRIIITKYNLFICQCKIYALLFIDRSLEEKKLPFNAQFDYVFSNSIKNACY